MTGALPRVCVALSVRDGARYLAESIESVLAQQGVELELRIFDNGSSDGSQAIARGYLPDPRVSFTVNEADLRFPGSMNRAACETEAEYLVPWACDDVMLPGNLEVKARALAESGADLCFGPMQAMTPDGRPTGIHPVRFGSSPLLFAPPSLVAPLVPYNQIPLPAALVRTSALRAAGGFDGRVPLSTDWLLWLELALSAPIVYVPQVSVLYREHEENGTSNAWRSGDWGRDLPATLEHVLARPDVPPGVQELAGPMRSALARYLADQLARRGHLRHDGCAYPAYESFAWSLLACPQDAEARTRFLTACTQAGLSAPALPAQAVAAAPRDAAEAAALVELFARLAEAGLARVLALAVPTDGVDSTVELLTPALEALPELEVEVFPGESLESLARPGRLCLAPWGGGAAIAAEAARIPALRFGAPDPLAGEPDWERWQRIPPELRAA